MKIKQFVLGLFLLSTFGASAQIITAESFANTNIDKYDGVADRKHQYVQAADGLKSRFELDQTDKLSNVTIIECQGNAKAKLYSSINAWFTKAFADKNSTIEKNDQASGTLEVKTVLKNIVKFPHQIVSVNMTVKINIKDDKVRVVNTIQQYTINAGTAWVSKKCYPFYDEQDALRKKIGSSAYVASCVFAEEVVKQIEEAVKPKAPVQDNNDDW